MVLCFTRQTGEPRDEYDAIPLPLRWLMYLGKSETDLETGDTILRLRNNRIIKTSCWSTEYQALKLVDRQTSIPAWKVVNVFNRPEGKMVEYEAFPGKPLHMVWPTMPAHQKNKIVADLGRYVEQLRAMKAPKSCVVGDATLGAALDPRFGHQRIGPFFSIQAFQEFERRGHSPYHFAEKEIHAVHQPVKPYELKFTHANLCPKNIIIDSSGRICALIGWESAGWYPEYWEYTQMCHATPKTMGDWLVAMCNNMTRYDQELLCEEALRSRYPSSVYDLPRSVRSPTPSPSEKSAEQDEVNDKNTDHTSG
ncbi:hypothetical protein B0A52_09337 [Exophiala mesophila]|uniref:Aminoglycoside phosphotransferase domain-containing protein n=1 Tax=Exophiala mesophila TaxID=212818 RepID=A0A438MUC5_EXOME|nr:hypothetical protein B0A52_09337 [Exophiala mesophila]